MAAFIAYLRVSTQRQGESGLGLAAQEAAITAHLKSAGGEVIGRYVEVESGKRCDRPQLEAALKRCRETGATLVVAKLDRLARDVLFVAQLMKAGIDFVACDMPFANRLTIHILAAVAEDEARRISERTTAALQAAKARGTKLGGYRGRELTTEERRAGQRAGVASRRANAARFAARTRPVIAQLQADGVSTLGGLARALNARGYRTARGGSWSAAQVKRVLEAAVAGAA